MFRFLFLCLSAFAITALVTYHFPSLQAHAFNLSTFDVTWFTLACGLVFVVGHRVTGGKH